MCVLVFVFLFVRRLMGLIRCERHYSNAVIEQSIRRRPTDACYTAHLMTTDYSSHSDLSACKRRGSDCYMRARLEHFFFQRFSCISLNSVGEDEEGNEYKK